MNKRSAKEWIMKAWHDLTSAQILFEANHYTDVIGIELHYSIEKLLKSFLIYNNKRVKKSHDLIEIFSELNGELIFDDTELDLLKIATDYHKEEVYPQYEKPLPSREEILSVLTFTKKLFNNVCLKLDINKNEVIN